MFSSGLEGHASSWLCMRCYRTGPQRVAPPPPFGCDRRPCYGSGGNWEDACIRSTRVRPRLVRCAAFGRAC